MIIKSGILYSYTFWTNIFKLDLARFTVKCIVSSNYDLIMKLLLVFHSIKVILEKKKKIEKEKYF